MPIQWDKSVVGESADLGTFEITEQMIRDYAEAVGASPPEAGEDLVAPPLFCNVLTTGGGGPRVKIEGSRRQFMAGQTYEPCAPVRPGDRLTGTARIHEIYEKTGRSGSMLFVIRENSFTNQDGVVVAKIYHRAVHQE